MISNEEFNTALKNENYVNILNKAGSRFESLIDKEELNQIKMLALWKALSSYSKNRGMKDTTYIYKYVFWDCSKFLRNNKDNQSFIPKSEKIVDSSREAEKIELNDILSTISDRERDIIEKYFLHGLSQKEIGKNYNYTEYKVSKEISSILTKLNKRI